MDSFQQIDRHDSRHGEKTKDIKKLVARMGDVQKKKQADWEKSFEDDLIAVTEETVLKGGVNCVGYTRAYAKNFAQAFGLECKRQDIIEKLGG